MIKIIRVDEIHKCFECEGKGYIEFTDHNSLERIRKKCEQCKGSGLLRYTGGVEIHPYIPLLGSNNEKDNYAR